MLLADPHSHTQPHGPGHRHRHGPASPHPAQASMGWSILQMTLVVRLAGAVAISAGLWAIVLLAMT